MRQQRQKHSSILYIYVNSVMQYLYIGIILTYIDVHYLLLKGTKIEYLGGKFREI